LLERGEERAEVLWQLIPQLHQTLLARALELFWSIGDVSNRVIALAALAPHVPENMHMPLVDQIVATAGSMQSDTDDPDVLTDVQQAVATLLRGSLLKKALALVLATKSDRLGWIFGALAPYLRADGYCWSMQG
jgi:hypothetical protein